MEPMSLCLVQVKGLITPLGGLLSHLPVDITIGKLMLMASLFHTVDAVLNVAAGLSTLSVFTHKSFRSAEAKGEGDFCILIKNRRSCEISTSCSDHNSKKKKEARKKNRMFFFHIEWACS